MASTAAAAGVTGRLHSGTCLAGSGLLGPRHAQLRVKLFGLCLPYAGLWAAFVVYIQFKKLRIVLPLSLTLGD